MFFEGKYWPEKYLAQLWAGNRLLNCGPIRTVLRSLDDEHVRWRIGRKKCYILYRGNKASIDEVYAAAFRSGCNKYYDLPGKDINALWNSDEWG